MTDLVKRLRASAREAVHLDAADYIEKLEREVHHAAHLALQAEKAPDWTVAMYVPDAPGASLQYLWQAVERLTRERDWAKRERDEQIHMHIFANKEHVADIDRADQAEKEVAALRESNVRLVENDVKQAARVFMLTKRAEAAEASNARLREALSKAARLAVDADMPFDYQADVFGQIERLRRKISTEILALAASLPPGHAPFPGSPTESKT